VESNECSLLLGLSSNRLKNNRVTKLLEVYRYFKSEDDYDSHSDENNFSIVEDSA